MSTMQALKGAGQFDAVLRQRAKASRTAQSEHFALHHLQHHHTMPEEGPEKTQAQFRLGFILPKRLSKQASRRNQIRRVWKAVISEAIGTANPLQALDFVVRQRSPFDAAQFRSPASPLLKAAVRQEAQALLLRVLAKLPQVPKLAHSAQSAASTAGLKVT